MEVRIGRGGRSHSRVTLGMVLRGRAEAEVFEAIAEDPFTALDGAIDAAQIWLEVGSAAPRGELPA